MQKGFAPIIAIIITVLITGGVLVYLGKLPIPTKTIPQPITAPAVNQIDETVNWKTYTNTEYNYSFRYPSNYILNNGVSDINTDGDSTPQIFVKTKDANSKYDKIFYVQVINKNPKSGDFIPDVYSNIFNTYTDLFLSAKEGNNIVIPYMTNLTFTRLSDKTVGKESAMVFRGNNLGGEIIVVNTDNYIYIFPGSGNDIYQQILSSFKFLDGDQNTTKATTTQKTTLKYSLPAGWKTARDQANTIEIGYNPQTNDPSVTYFPGGVAATGKWEMNPPKRIGENFTAKVGEYDGGSRHTNLYKWLGLTAKELRSGEWKAPGFLEKEYSYNNWPCLVFVGFSVSQLSVTQGICPINTLKAIYFSVDSRDLEEVETFMQAIRVLQ